MVVTDHLHSLIKRVYDKQRLDFTAPYHCIKDDWIYSNFYNAYTLVQVPGERFFILTAKEAIQHISDPLLLDECKTFIAQEGEHAKIHHAYNEALLSSHYTRAKQIIEQWDTTFARWTSPHLPLKQRLLFVVMAEIFTAHIAEDFFQRWHGHWDQLNGNIALLFSFHNVEEIEHKSLCFDVFQHIYQEPPNAECYHSEWQDFKQMMITQSIKATTYFCACDSLLHQQPIRTYQEIHQQLTADNAIFPNGDLYPQYASEDFHPWQHDTRHWIDTWQNEWLKQLNPQD